MELGYGVFFGDELLNENETSVASLHSTVEYKCSFYLSVKLIKQLPNFLFTINNDTRIFKTQHTLLKNLILNTEFFITIHLKKAIIQNINNGLKN